MDVEYSVGIVFGIWCVKGGTWDGIMEGRRVKEGENKRIKVVLGMGEGAGRWECFCQDGL